MDGCLRLLRDGGPAGAAAVVLLVDEVQGSPGGDAVLQKLVTDTVNAISEGRSRAQLLHAVAIDKPPSELKAMGVSSLTDCFTDPCGWVQPISMATPDLPSCNHKAGSIQWQDLQLLLQLHASGLAALTASDCGCCLVLTGLSTLLLRHPEMEVLQLLHQLQASSHVCSMLLPIHQDLHSPHILSALHSLSSATLHVMGVQRLAQQLVSQAIGRPCHGQLTFSSKRTRLGRLRVEQQLYSLVPTGGVEVFAAPQGVVLDAQALVQTAISQQQQHTHQQLQEGKQQQQQHQQSPGQVGGEVAEAAQGQLAQKLSSSMRLDMSEQERVAKSAVQLPYVHQGGGKAYASGDARQYLPPAAGGYGLGVEAPGRLGHILYVRDSDEEQDSDEDPDDDLDV